VDVIAREVWEAIDAGKFNRDPWEPIADAIAAAVAQEREACALVADAKNVQDMMWNGCCESHAELIAETIRERGNSDISDIEEARE
jgi:hypothetical protein